MSTVSITPGADKRLLEGFCWGSGGRYRRKDCGDVDEDRASGWSKT
jgi:hypothetical protein